MTEYAKKKIGKDYTSGQKTKQDEFLQKTKPEQTQNTSILSQTTFDTKAKQRLIRKPNNI